MKQTLKTFVDFLREILSHTFKKYSRHLPYFIIILIALVIVVGGINLFVELTETLATEELADWVTRITDYVLSFRTPAWTIYFLWATCLGDVFGYLTVVVIFAVISGLAFKRWKYVVKTTLVLLLATVSNMMLKKFVDRAKPGVEHLVSVDTLSYPSGHVMSVVAFYDF